MHIDHSKLIELLTEALGMEADKVEAQLAELVEEISEAVSEGDAYEVDGLGVFSGIGNNIMFIPAEDFATEINYKYVGMEPIEIEGSTKDVDVKDASDQSEEIALDEEEDDPFAGLLDDEEEEEAAGSSFVMDLLNDEENEYGDSEDPVSEEEQEADKESGESADDDEPPFDLDNLESEKNEEQDDTSDEEVKPGPDKWGIDTYKDDSDAGMFSGLLGDKKEETEPPSEDGSDEGDDNDDLSSIFDDSDEDDDDDLASELSKQLEDDDSDSEESDIEDIFGSESDNEDEEQDFEDPFESLADEEDEPEEEKEDEVVPVITNLASESAKKKRKEKEAEEDDESKAEESLETAMRPPSSRDKKGQPVILWVLLIIIAFAGGTYGLGYFGVLDIPGITPEPQITSTQSPVSPPEQDQQEETQPNESATEDSEQTPGDDQTSTPDDPPAVSQEPEETVKEQPAEALVSQNSDVPNDQPMYGLKGVSNPEANSGYTIVIYSLSDEGNARNKITELNNDGYRALLASVPSQQYGQLWRVSLGQFESLRTAALAAETLEAPFSENYFITKIK